MSKFPVLISIFLLAFLMIVPHLADARAGGGRSMGSMGSRTYSPSAGAAPIQRSITPPSSGSSSPGSNFPGASPAYPGASGGSPFFRGLAGGFLGAGLASMLFGHGGGMGYGGGSGGAFGGLLQILFLGGIIYFVVKMFKGGGFSNIMPKNNLGGNVLYGNFTPAATNTPQLEAVPTSLINVTESDKEYFEQLLSKVQSNWSEGNIKALRQYVTPEMVQYFSEELSANSSRGLENKVENLTLKKAVITNAWHEFDLDYATARLDWEANDYMVKIGKNPGDADYIASGSESQLTDVAEIWTFVRGSGGNWMLSAIQQVA